MEDGSMVSFEYDLRFNKVRRATDPKGTITTYECDDHGNLITRVEALGTPCERTTTYTYNDQNLLITAVTQADAHTEEAVLAGTVEGRSLLINLRHTNEYNEKHWVLWPEIS